MTTPHPSWRDILARQRRLQRNVHEHRAECFCSGSVKGRNSSSYSCHPVTAARAKRAGGIPTWRAKAVLNVLAEP